MLRIFRPDLVPHPDPVVVTGIGLVTSNGRHREEVWEAVQNGVSGIRRLHGVPGVPEHLEIGGIVDTGPNLLGPLKVMELARRAADEAMRDSGVDLALVDRERFGCAVSAHFGDIRWWKRLVAPERTDFYPTFEATQWLPNSACADLSQLYGLLGPRYSHSTACASGLVDILSAVRAIRDGQCDLALAGSSDVIDPLFAAGFQQMRVLATHEDATQACRPFDRRRNGFVMGEGAGMFVLERLDHALGRGAKIYAEIASGKMLADAHHVTGLDVESNTLARLISDALRAADITPQDVGYINAHGTGTEQNDLLESRGIRRALGASADDVVVSSLKAMIGHLVNASGSVELALTILGMRDGFAPPTLNLTDPDPACDLDFLPLLGRPNRYQHAVKLALAFGGHLVAAVVRRWNHSESGFAYPQTDRRAA